MSEGPIPESEEIPAPEEAELSATNQEEVEHLIDERLTALQAGRAERRQRMEYIKFGILAVILLGAVVVIALAQPTIFDNVVPAVMGGSSADEAMDEVQPVDEIDPAEEDPDAGDNTQNLPIITSPGTDDESEAGETEADPATAVPAQTYVVQAGDTLNSIARQFNTTVEAIVAANDIPNPDNVLAGTTLIIPQAVP